MMRPQAAPPRRPRRRALIPALVLLAPALAAASDPPARAEGAARSGAAEVIYDPAVPVGAVRSYLEACRRGRYAEAAAYLDLEALDPASRPGAGPRLARQLKVVLDRKLWIHYELLSAEPAGQADDRLPPDLDRVGTVGQAEILLARVEVAPGVRHWKFASSTVERIPELYSEFGYGPLEELLPSVFFEVSLLEIQLWQWIGLLLLVSVAYGVSWVLTLILRRVLHALARRTATQLDDMLADALVPPLRGLLGLGLFALGSLALALSVPVHAWLAGLEKGLALAIAAWLAVRATDVIAETTRRRLVEADHQTALAALPLGRRAAKVVLLALAGVAVLQNLGFNVTGLVAGLGVGGLAVALAAQKSIANLFGGVSLIADRPVRVGDFCRFGDGRVGTVEEVGLRSTRVRTLDRTLVTVPNAEFSEIQLENFAARDRIRLFAVLNLRYESTPDQLRWLLAAIRRLFVEHPMVAEAPARARFVAFGAYSLDVEIFAYVTTTEWDVFLKVREDLFLRIMDLVEESGCGFAFPSQTLYLGRDSGIDEERRQRCEQQVARWREEQRLPFPDFSDEMMAGWRDTADWPPTGSAARVGARRDGPGGA